MEFLKVKRFNLRTGTNTPKEYFSLADSKSDKLKISCMKYSAEDETITVGLSNGYIGQFCNQRFNIKRLTHNKEHEFRLFSHISNPHKGEIRCLLYEKIFGQSYAITGSSDRTIKIWDTDGKSKAVIQTIVGHNGTILALAYSKYTDTLFSCSNDQELCIWKQEKNREMFLNPWYIKYQVVNDFAVKRVDYPVYPTSVELRDGEKEKFMLYVGDSEGNLHEIRIKEAQIKDSKKKDTKMVFERDKPLQMHRLSIHRIVCITKYNILYSISYDQTVCGFEYLTGKKFFRFPNSKKLLFSAIVWMDGLLAIADEGGNLYFVEMNSYKEPEEVKKYDCRILGLQYLKDLDELLICTETFVDVVKVKKGVKSGEGNSHSDSIIGIFALEPFKLTKQKIKDSPKLITVSLDNTMRVWDPQDLTCIQVMRNPEKSYIACLSYLKHANLFATGHYNGVVRLWNIELGNSITVDQSYSNYRHENTVCCISSFIYERGPYDITYFMFTSGYEGKVNVWEIFYKKNIAQSMMMSSTICPQLKNSFFANNQQRHKDVIGQYILVLAVYEYLGKEQYDPETRRYIIAAGSAGSIYFIKMFTFYHEESVLAHNDSINSLLIDQNILFSGSHDGTIKMWSLDDRSQLTQFSVSEDGIRHLSLIEETGHLVSLSISGEITCWDYPRKKVIMSFSEKSERILTFGYINESQSIYVGTQEANIYSHNIEYLYGKKKELYEPHSEEYEMRQLIRKNYLEIYRSRK